MSLAAAHFGHGKVEFAVVASEASLFSFSTKFAQSEASELKPPVMNHFMPPNSGLSMQCKGSWFVR